MYVLSMNPKSRTDETRERGNPCFYAVNMMRGRHFKFLFFAFRFIQMMKWYKEISIDIFQVNIALNIKHVP